MSKLWILLSILIVCILNNFVMAQPIISPNNPSSLSPNISPNLPANLPPNFAQIQPDFSLNTFSPGIEVINGGTIAMSLESVSQPQNLWQKYLLTTRAANMCFSACDPTDDVLCPCHCSSSPGRVNGEQVWLGESVWINGFGYSAHQNTRKEFRGHRSRMFGNMLGIQRPISENWQAGIGVGYVFTDIEGKNLLRSSTHIETPQSTVYLGYTCNTWFLDNFFTYSWSHYKGSRDLLLPGIRNTAKIEYRGEQYSFLLSTGYNFFIDSGLKLTPLASLQLQKLRIGGSKEYTALNSNLLKVSQNYFVIQPALGLMLGINTNLCSSFVYSEIHTKFGYDLKSYQVKNVVRPIGIPTFVDQRIAIPGRYHVNIGLSSTIFMADYWSLKGSYEYNIGQKISSQVGSIFIAYKF